MIELEKVKPASRFKRFIANVLDSLIILLPVLVVLFILVFMSNSISEPLLKKTDYSELVLVLALVYFVASFIYFSVYESSSYQATPGKILFKLYVATSDNKKLSKKRAILRLVLYILPSVVGSILSKLLSITSMNLEVIILIENILTLLLTIIWFGPILFKDRKGLHDRLSNTQVLSRK